MLPYGLTFAQTPAILRRMIAGIPSERYAESLGEDRYTLRETVAHLADTEAVFSERMREAVARDVPVYDRLDMAQRAIDLGFAGRDLDAELAQFARLRAETVGFLQGLTEAELDREFVHAFGRMTVREFVAVLTGHDLYHLDAVSEHLGLHLGLPLGL